MKISELDDKKRNDAEMAEFHFRTRQISVANLSRPNPQVPDTTFDR